MIKSVSIIILITGNIQTHQDIPGREIIPDNKEDGYIYPIFTTYVSLGKGRGQHVAIKMVVARRFKQAYKSEL